MTKRGYKTQRVTGISTSGSISIYIAQCVFPQLMHWMWCALFLFSVFTFTIGIARAEPGLASRTPEEQRTIEVYKRANLAVVFITTKTYVADPFDLLDSMRPQEGTGTGTVVDAQKGLVLTNLHVIRSVLESGGSVEIMLVNGQNARARLVGYDAETDLALFKLTSPPPGLVGLEFSDSSKLEVGQRVLAIGNPFGLHKSLTAGIISSLDRTMKTPEGAVLRGLIQTDAAINPGNSGGPLLDADGRLIGINTAILSQSGDSAGIGFAVPINTVKRILPDLISTGKVLRAQLGWKLADTDQGPMVSVVSPGGPAERAGLQPIHRPVSGVFVRGYRRDIDAADLITKVNGQKVHHKDEVEELINQSDSGKPIRLTVRQGGAYGRERVVEVFPELR